MAYGAYGGRRGVWGLCRVQEVMVLMGLVVVVGVYGGYGHCRGLWGV